jgi:hypothetical protein
VRGTEYEVESDEEEDADSELSDEVLHHEDPSNDDVNQAADPSQAQQDNHDANEAAHESLQAEGGELEHKE